MTVASNLAGLGVVDIFNRWDKKTNQYHPDQRLLGVTIVAWVMLTNVIFSIAIYKTTICSRKWTLQMFTHTIDLVVKNAWLEYRCDATTKGIPKKETEDLIHFRQHLVEFNLLFLMKRSEAILLAHHDPHKFQQSE